MDNSNILIIDASELVHLPHYVAFHRSEIFKKWWLGSPETFETVLSKYTGILCLEKNIKFKHSVYEMDEKRNVLVYIFTFETELDKLAFTLAFH